MRIIKQGVAPTERVYCGTCRNCETEIEFKQHEAKTNFDQRDGNYLSIKCPTCGETIWTNV